MHPEWWATLVAWSNIGSLLGGVAAVVVALAAVRAGPAALKDWRSRQREQAAVAREEAYNIQLDRQRSLYGWSPGGVAVYGVDLVTEPAEMAQAFEQLSSGGPTAYVLARVSESPSANENRALDLRQLIDRTHLLARAPERAEYDALLAGRRVVLGPDSSWLGPDISQAG